MTIIIKGRNDSITLHGTIPGAHLTRRWLFCVVQRCEILLDRSGTTTLERVKHEAIRRRCKK